MDSWDYKITKVEAISGDPSARSLVAYSGADLDGAMARPGQPGATEKSKLAGGTMAVVYMWGTGGSEDAVPPAGRPPLSVVDGNHPPEMTVENAAIAPG